MSSAAPEVELAEETHPPGMRGLRWYGPVAAEVIESDRRRWRKAIQRVRRRLRQKARRASEGRATHIVGLEQTVDPFHPDGVRFHAAGTVALMEPINPEEERSRWPKPRA